MFCEDGLFIIFIVFFLFFTHQTKKLVEFCDIKPLNEQREREWERIKKTMKCNPFKTVSFPEHTSGRWAFNSGTREAEITGLVIVSSKPAELWERKQNAVFHQTAEKVRRKGQRKRKQQCFCLSMFASVTISKLPLLNTAYLNKLLC